MLYKYSIGIAAFFKMADGDKKWGNITGLVQLAIGNHYYVNVEELPSNEDKEKVVSEKQILEVCKIPVNPKFKYLVRLAYFFDLSEEKAHEYVIECCKTLKLSY